VLPTANYYFAFQVGNEIASSNLSTTSSILNWTTGSSGGVVNGFAPSSYATRILNATATALIRFSNDGTIKRSSNGGALTTIGNWYLPTTASIGVTPGYWLYTTVTSGTLTTGTTGAWTQLSVDRDYTVSRTVGAGVGISSVDLAFTISSSSSGTPALGYGTGHMEAEQTL